MVRPAILGSLLLTMALAISACGGGGGATPTAEGPALTPEEVLSRAALVMAEVTSFRFSLESQKADTPLPAGLAMRRATGAMVKPDRFDGEITALFSGFIVKVRVISVGDRTFMTNPITRDWQGFDSGLSPVAFFDTAKGVTLILQSMVEPTFGEAAVADGVAAYRVVGRLPAQAVQFIAGGYAEGAILDAELLIGKGDFTLREGRLTGAITEEEPPEIVRVLTFSEFNTPFVIEPPI